MLRTTGNQIEHVILVQNDRIKCQIGALYADQILQTSSFYMFEKMIKIRKSIKYIVEHLDLRLSTPHAPFLR